MRSRSVLADRRGGDGEFDDVALVKVVLRRDIDAGTVAPPHTGSAGIALLGDSTRAPHREERRW